MKKNNKGFTLVETIMGMIVIAIAFYTLIAIFTTLAPRTARVENINKKVYLAQGKMEEYLAKPFSGIISVSSQAFPGYFSNYNFQIVVTPVQTSELNTYTPNPTPFKNVKVRVWGGPVDAMGTFEVTTLVATYESK